MRILPGQPNNAASLAQRLEATAGPGAILLGAKDYDLVSQWIVADPLAPLQVKGRAEPVPCFRLVGTRRRAEAPAGLKMTRHLPVEPSG